MNIRTLQRPHSPQVAPASGLTSLLLLALFTSATLVACMQRTTTSRSVTMDEPTASSGVFLDEADPHRLSEMAAALDAIRIGPEGATSESAAPMFSIDEPDSGATESAVAAGMVQDAAAPTDAVALISLPKLSDIEIRELIDYLALKLQADAGYTSSAAVVRDMLPPPPERVASEQLVSREADGKTFVVQFGHRRFISQPPQLWVQGVVIDRDGAITTNPDVADIGEQVTAAITSMNEMRGGVTVHDLDSKLIQLSYTDASTAVTLLKAMGISTFNDPGGIPAAVDYNQLPYVIAVPDPEAGAIGLVGKATTAGGKFGLSLTPNVASELPGQTIATPLTQLLVLYHPTQPGQFSRVRRLLDERIDRPARQIFVEGLVLEISEEGLDELGIEWELDGASLVLNAGTLNPEGVDETLGIVFDDFLDPSFTWSGRATLRALIREGKAEVLSRPSVLTLNNRQATIRVGTDIPISTSQEGLSGVTSKLSFDFSYLATGILLNVRPRISESGSEVSMLIDTIVSDTVRGADLEIRSNDGELLASAPTISTRRVQTYARIRNNTPFIIGGLVSREKIFTQEKVPLLGDIPWVGALFRSERNRSEKREVIIVLTPYVLPEYQERLTRSLPKDEDAFDSFGNELFRDSYRIRTRDVFDLAFLRENKRLSIYRELAAKAIAQDFTLEYIEPFSEFADGRVPGESILVVRMMYEVIKRLDLEDVIEVPNIIYFEDKQIGGYDVRFLEQAMAAIGGGETNESFFQSIEGKALAMTYSFDRVSLEAGRLASEPIPTVTLVECPDRETWGNLLWEMNQPDAGGNGRFTILIHDESDLVRLRRAIALKKIIQLNGGEPELRLQNFNVGKVLLMPDLKPAQIHVADADVARLFFATEHYYAAMINQLEQSLNELDRVLRAPSFPIPELKHELEATEIDEVNGVNEAISNQED